MWMPVILIYAQRAGHKAQRTERNRILYPQRSQDPINFVHGGALERKRRAGTENVPGVVGMGQLWAYSTMETRTAKERKLRDYLIERLRQKFHTAA